jgi:hypothetical protein
MTISLLMVIDINKDDSLFRYAGNHPQKMQVNLVRQKNFLHLHSLANSLLIMLNIRKSCLCIIKLQY